MSTIDHDELVKRKRRETVVSVEENTFTEEVKSPVQSKEFQQRNSCHRVNGEHSGGLDSNTNMPP